MTTRPVRVDSPLTRTTVVVSREHEDAPVDNKLETAVTRRWLLLWAQRASCPLLPEVWRGERRPIDQVRVPQ
jgi:hypothetical protein